MRAGYLRHRLLFQSKSVARSASGAEVVTWADAFEVWGSVEPLRGREFEEAQQQQADIQHRVRIRERSGVENTMRIKFDLDSRDPQYLYVVSVREPFVRGIDLEIMCREDIES